MFHSLLLIGNCLDEANHVGSYFLKVVFQNKMPTIQQHKLRMRQISQIRLRSLHPKNWIVLAPHNESWKLVLPECGVEARVARKVALVVVEEIELDLIMS